MAKRIFVGGFVIWLVLLAIMAAVTFLKLKDEDSAQNKNDPVTSNPSASDLLEGSAAEGDPIDLKRILGNWTSDRTDQNMMMLNEDYTFKDTDLMGEGTIEIKGSYLILTNSAGEEYVMLYREDMDEFYYTIDKYVSVYHRASKDEAEEKAARAEHRLTERESEEADCIKAAQESIVNTSWGAGRDYVAFKTNTFVRCKNDFEQEYAFDIVSASYIEGDPTGYSMELAVTDMDGVEQKCEFFMLLFGNDELLPSIEFSLNGEIITLQDTYKSGGEIDWDEENYELLEIE